ncbi:MULTISPECIES: dienelactone hydrolase family protein [unclassified Pseudomonas]|uniref:dienelactone hydrolase family protein n=1 Tax=unclassified Pseudomonas TaxID=196821 RepID=UPI0031333691
MLEPRPLPSGSSAGTKNALSVTALGFDRAAVQRLIGCHWPNSNQRPPASCAKASKNVTGVGGDPLFLLLQMRIVIQLKEALETANVSPHLIVYPDVGHRFICHHDSAITHEINLKALNTTIQFFDPRAFKSNLA